MTTKPLTAKRKKPVKAGTSKEAAAQRKALFVQAMIANGGNGTQAAIAAGFSAKTARQAASRLLTDAAISQQIAESRASVIEKMELTTERTLREIARLAYVDPRKFFHADGRPKEITELDDDTAAALAVMEVTEEWDGQGKDRRLIGHTKKYKLADKNAALEKAMKHLGQYQKDNKQAGEAAVNALGKLLAGMKKSSLQVVEDPADD